MNSSAQFLNASEAAGRLGVSTKALRLYEHRGFFSPIRTAAGWRAYGPSQMARAGEIVALRALGFSLAQIERVLGGDPKGLEQALAGHQATLEGQLHKLVAAVEKIGRLRTDLVQGRTPAIGELVRLVEPAAELRAAFDLPWPWGGERFELAEIRPLTYIIGPLGSGKTRLARRLAETLPGAAFLGLDRLEQSGRETLRRLEGDLALKARVDQTLAWLTEDGAEVSDALLVLLVGLEAEDAAITVVDMVEQGLDQATQEALITHLRNRADGRPLFLLTRSSAILDLASVGVNEAVILCPANHSPPMQVRPYPGAPGYEAVATCLASPEVRARTAGIIAWKPEPNPESHEAGTLDPGLRRDDLGARDDVVIGGSLSPR